MGNPHGNTPGPSLEAVLSEEANPKGTLKQVQSDHEHAFDSFKRTLDDCYDQGPSTTSLYFREDAKTVAKHLVTDDVTKPD